MAKTDERIELIGEAIISQAKQESRDLIDKANAFGKEELSRFEEEIVDGMFGKVQSKATRLRLESVKSGAREQLEAHRELLSHRAKKTGAVFKSVKTRLIEYSATGEYKADILSRAEALKANYSYDHSSSVIFVRECDLALGEEINAALGGSSTVKPDPAIQIGGFRLVNGKSGVLVDETLDERLDEQRIWFLQNCGLKII